MSTVTKGSSALKSKAEPVIRDAATAGLVQCRLCSAGFRRVGGVHIGSQRLGMIPDIGSQRLRMIPDIGSQRLRTIPDIGSQRLRMIPDMPCDRVFATRGEGADTGRPWLAHVDGVPLRKLSGEARRFASPAAAYAAAQRGYP